jgi:hypothetical protein
VPGAEKWTLDRLAQGRRKQETTQLGA